MACNWHVITCHYMHYMPLHAIEDANAERIAPSVAGVKRLEAMRSEKEKSGPLLFKTNG